MCKILRKLFPKLPYPEERANYDQTLENTDIDSIVIKWLENYKVPQVYWDYWRNDGVIFKLKYDTVLVWINGKQEHAPAQTTRLADGKTLLEARPEWFNPGIIAHEQAHNSYGFLTEQQKLDWVSAYKEAKKEGLVKLVFSEHPYANANDIEAHAEVFRYLGLYMPEGLKKYYPKLAGG